MADPDPLSPAPTHRFVRIAAAVGPYGVVLLVGLFVLLPGLGEFGFWDSREPRYAQSAREMLERDSYLVPYYRGEIRMTEPILVYWSILAGSAVFGLNEFGARIGGVVVALASMLGVYYAVATLRGRRAGALAASVLGTVPQFYFLSRQAAPEIYLLAGLGSFFLFLCLGLFGPPARRTVHLVVAYVCFAVAVLAAPVVSCVIGLATLATCAVGRSDWRRLWRSNTLGRQLLLSGALLTLVAGPWYGAVLIGEGPAAVSSLILDHGIAPAFREVNDDGGSAYYYLRVLIFGWFPWSGFVATALVSLVDWRQSDALRRHGPEALLVIACAVTFAALSGAATKHPYYLAPLIIPLAVLIGLVIDRTLDREESPAARLVWIVAAMLYVLPMMDLFTTQGLRYLIGSFTPEREVPVEVVPGPYGAALLVLIAALLLASVLMRARLPVLGLVVAATLLAHHHTRTLIPILSQHKSLKALCESWHRHAMPGDRLSFYGEPKESFVFYAGKQVEWLDDTTEFLEFMRPTYKAFSVVEAEEFPALQRAYGERYGRQRLTVVDSSHFDYRLIANHPVAR